MALLVSVPLIPTWLIYMMSMKIYQHRWKAIHTAVNWTTIFYIISVLILFNQFFNQSFLGIISIAFVIMLSIIIIVQWKKDKEVSLLTGLKLLWRIYFLIFFLLYICLILFGIIHRMFYF